MNVRRLLGSLLLALGCIPPALSAAFERIDLGGNPAVVWKIHAASTLPQEALSSMHKPGFSTADWIAAQVPGTVFGSFVADGLEPDPNYADNISRVDRARYDQDYWYRAEFTVPAGFSRGRLWLNFLGVNRDAEVYLNGVRLGQIQGIVHRGRFDISGLVESSGANRLAVLVRPPQAPISNGASPTYGSSAGWDWMPSVPGLNSGIQDDVFLSTTAEVSILDPWIRADLPENDEAQVSVEADLLNSSDRETTGILEGEIAPEGVHFSLNVSVPAHETKRVRFDSQGFPQLDLKHPALWWPNTYGPQALHSCQLAYTMDGRASDSTTVSFGIRRLQVETSTRVMKIFVNGVRIFARGGNWGMPEYLLRNSPADYDTRIRLHRDMNFTMIRNWMGSTTRDAFYQACDRYGLLVWDDFWLNSSGGLPRDLMVFQANVIEKLKRLRNHPSIALWCGDNEGYPSPPLDDWLATDVRVFDGRHYHPNSHSDSLSGSGPWTQLDPRDYFLHAAPGSWGGEQGWGMRSEIGAAAFVNFDSFRIFIPKENWWPRNSMWDKHFFGPSATYAGPDAYEKAVASRYGRPRGIEDFCRKAQLLNLETHKALFEGWLDHLWDDASGVLLWMSQPAFPSMVWQTYDYYFDATGAYWGAKSACEPVHIQWNCGNDSVKVINHLPSALLGVHADARVYGMDGREIEGLRQTCMLDAQGSAATACFRLHGATGDLAQGAEVRVSSVHVPGREGDKLVDGDAASRWESGFETQPWAAIDLGAPQRVNRVVLHWEPEHARVYKLQVSDDGLHWRDVSYQPACPGGTEVVTFPPAQARWVRMYCLEKATTIGISLNAIEVFGDAPRGADAPNFLRLLLTDSAGRRLSENLYWRGIQPLDYTALDSLPPAKLEVRTEVATREGKRGLLAHLSNAADAPAPAFAIRLQVLDSATGARILPIFADENYLTLMRGESRDIFVAFDAPEDIRDRAKLSAEPFNARR